ncbi:hypothetical protein BJX61DRAFT_38441 [Aspergillus egyptiacus]|nr:hypothetical protein BJX61DRAFT_38441 [Aspergillus egyptiacus]
MADYSTWKVTDLKAELKRRGIPQTGLRVKQQIIDRLVEEDSKADNDGAEEASATPDQPPHDESQATESRAVEPSPVEAQPVQPQPVETEDSAKAEHTDQEQSRDAAHDASPSQGDLKAAEEKTAEEPVEKPDEKSVEKTHEVTPQAPAPRLDRSADRAPQSAQTDEQPRQGALKLDGKDTSIGVDNTESGGKTAPKPAEQASGVTAGSEPPNTAQEDATQVEVTEKIVLPGTQASGVSTELSTPLPTEELVEDVRKRKRRSQSPPPHPDEVVRKRAKALNDAESQGLPDGKDIDTANGTHDGEGSARTPHEVSQAAPQEAPFTEDGERRLEAAKSVHQKQDMRFKGLFTPAGLDQPRPEPPLADVEMEDAEVKPALHAATAALYIDGLMRPLQPVALKNHLLSVASAPGASPNPDLIVDFYLDFIKTHCFVKFVDVATASRARSALHDTVWPNERNRKSLFVDFIPEDKIQEWIQREEEARGRRGPPPRWEVKYDTVDGRFEASLEEVDPRNAGTHAPRGPAAKEFTHPPPRGPRAEFKPQERRPSGPSRSDRDSHPGHGFKPLDELFKSTTTKPKLYYLPVPREIADRRLDRFDDLLRKGSFPRRGGDETRRISFEDGDYFVDHGPEFAGRGRGGGRGRGRGRGMIDTRRNSRRDRY